MGIVKKQAGPGIAVCTAAPSTWSILQLLSHCVNQTTSEEGMGVGVMFISPQAKQISCRRRVALDALRSENMIWWRRASTVDASQLRAGTSSLHFCVYVMTKTHVTFGTYPSTIPSKAPC